MGSITPGGQVDVAQATGPRFEQPQPAGVPAWRMGHRKSAGDNFVGLNVDQDSAAFLVFTPAAARVRLTEGSHPLRLAIAKAQPIEVTAVIRREL